ncbi:MAG TPA: hypothetical protein VKT81_11710 [Bryobacteraceae bacterium]|nr:hypothetical protein [Bryobacteraceae bacterium]
MTFLQRMTYLRRACYLALLIPVSSEAASLPSRYYQLMEAGCASVEKHLNELPNADLKTIEQAPEHHTGSSLEISWAHFGYSILPPALLYAKRHPANARYHDPKMLALAIRIGDLLAAADEKDEFEPRLDSDWDTYTWLEAYRLLEPDLGEARKKRWERAIVRNASLLVANAIDRLDAPWYQTPYILTSPNHYAQWASLLMLTGRTFGNQEWEKLGARILKRFAVTEQSTDGYWGEHNSSGPTTGYNHLTLQSVALYWELTHDPDALPALRRATTFHENFTFLDGTPVDVINDRNRHWATSSWAHFVFSNFADGRGYAEYLANFFEPEHLTMNLLGRIAQDALYYHEGPTEPPPQSLPEYHFQMSIPAGIRKTGPWQVALSGIMSTQAINNQYYLDREGNVSVFHKNAGLIVTGAGSKRQPELATFSQTAAGQTTFLPISTRLQMGDREDRLSLGYNTFFSDLYVPKPSENELALHFKIIERSGPTENGKLTLQLVLKAGEVLETGAGKKITLGPDRVELSPADLGGSIRHHGWNMRIDPTARLVWPVYPFNPYANSPETSIEWAVGTLSVDLHPVKPADPAIRHRAQDLDFVISVGDRQ